MKYRALWKDTFREIPKSVMRFLAIMIIIFLGVGFFVGISATSPDMIKTVDQYFDEQNLMDFRVQSTYGLTEQDIDALNNLDNATVQSHYAYDFLVEDYSETIRLYSYDTNNGQAINQYHIAEGRLPKATGEIALDTLKSFLTDTEIGDTIRLVPGKQNGAPENHLALQTFEVVGFVNTPLYITHTARGNTTVGNGSLDGFGVILEDDYETDYYTEANITIAGAEAFEVFSDDYEEYIDTYETELEQILTALETQRGLSIQDEAQEEIDEGWQEIEDAEQELAEAELELADARAELDEAWAEFEDGYAEFNEQRDDVYFEIDENERDLEQTINDLEAQRQDLISQRANLNDQLNALDHNEEQLIAGQEQLQDGLAQINDGIAQIEANRPAIEAGLQEISNQRNTLTNQRSALVAAREGIMELDVALAENEAQLTLLQAQLEEAEPEGRPAIEAKIAELETEQANLTASRAAIGQQFDNPDITVTEIENLIDQINAGLAQLDTQEEEVRAPLVEADALISRRTGLESQLNDLEKQAQELQAGREQLRAGIEQIDDGIVQIDDGLVQANDGFAELDEARETAATEFEEAEQELLDGEAELNEAEEEYREGLLTFQEERETALAEIEDARLELEDAQNELSNLADPDYFSARREENSMFIEYKDNTDRLAVIANVFPVFFFLIAIFISFTTMTRMVDEEREYIGIMKALGYGNNQILVKFLTYSIFATSLGVILGLVFGYTFIPTLIFDAYGSMYNLPPIHLQQYTLYSLLAAAAAFFSTVGASLLAVKNSLRSNAATLLQPKAPTKGTHIWLEKLPFIWRRLSFNHKITFRNVFRYKSRMFMTIFGIAGSTGLVLTGFGISDSISSIPDIQYGELNHFQAYVALDTNASENVLSNYILAVDNHPDITDAIMTKQENVTLEQDGVNTQEATVFVPEEVDQFSRYITLRDLDTKEHYTLDDSGAFVTHKLAQLFSVGVGDEMTLLDADNEARTIEIAGVVENYVGHTIYMTSAYYQEVTATDEIEANLSLLTYDADSVSESEIGTKLMNQNAVLGITYSTDIYDAFSDTLSSLGLITQILVIAAAALAFIILYNLTNINVSERERELSTIKVLGFHDKEVTMYIYRENIILTAIGIFFGCLFGTILVRFIMATMEVDNLVFAREIHLSSYLYSILLTILFTLIVMAVIHFQLKRIDMVEALKAND